MPLSIGMNRDEALYIGDVRVDVDDRGASGRVLVKVYSPELMPVIHELSASSKTEILPGVFVWLGPRSRGVTRLLFDAPANIRILRASLRVRS